MAVIIYVLDEPLAGEIERVMVGNLARTQQIHYRALLANQDPSQLGQT